MSFKLSVVFSLLFLLCFSCQEKEKISSSIVGKSDFYYWRSNFKPSENELGLLRKIESKKLFVRVFDVKISVDEQEPYAFTNMVKGSWMQGFEYIPCVYLENPVFYELDSSAIQDLAAKIKKRLAYFQQEWQFKELQIDCDWTAETRDRFFYFLTCFLNEGVEISSTVRLHQIKFVEKMGVPPVKKAYLMCYNMGNLKNWTEENSIFDFEVMKSYLKNVQKYPLGFDVALPLFSWSVVYRRGNFKSISTEIKDFSDNEKFKRVGKNRFEVMKSHKNGRTVFLKGDQIRFEAVETKDLKRAIHFFQQVSDSQCFVFFDLDEKNVFKIDSLLN